MTDPRTLENGVLAEEVTLLPVHGRQMRGIQTIHPEHGRRLRSTETLNRPIMSWVYHLSSGSARRWISGDDSLLVWSPGFPHSCCSPTPSRADARPPVETTSEETDTLEWLSSPPILDTASARDEAFSEACAEGELETARELYGEGGVDLHTDGDMPLIMAAAGGHQHVLQWLMTLDDCGSQTIRWACARALGEGHLQLVEWLWEDHPEWEEEDWSESFRMAYTGGHLEAVVWMEKRELIEVGDVAVRLSELCRDSSLEMIQHLYQYLEPEQLDYVASFVQASSRGRLDLLQWLWSQEEAEVVLSPTSVEVRRASRLSFWCRCCRVAYDGGHRDVVNWLHSVDSDVGETFRYLWLMGLRPLCRYLFQLGVPTETLESIYEQGDQDDREVLRGWWSARRRKPAGCGPV